MSNETKPAWWPTAEQKRHADAGCAHPDECKVATEIIADAMTLGEAPASEIMAAVHAADRALREARA